MNPAPLVVLVGNPNAGKSALFNALTGARQKVGNYPGVTVERKSGRMALDDGRPIELVDLPGTYSLDPVSPDEQVTRDVLFGKQEGERRPDVLVVVVDATNLDNHLRFAIQLIALGLPTIVVLNMIDMAERDGTVIDQARLSAELGVPVLATVAVRKRGLEELRAAIGRATAGGGRPILPPLSPETDLTSLQRRARSIARAATTERQLGKKWTERIDRVVLHPVAGFVILLLLMFVMFQAVFSWSEAPIGWIEGLQAWLADTATASLPDTFLRAFLVEAIINGVGSVVVFLPQILILFAFILVLEATGYMVRAAFVMDKLMAGVGLSGRAFIPLLSSFACAIPGIMATRSIDDPRDRLTTILIAPLMTCSARLPVYTLIIGAFIPAEKVGPGIGLQGLVLFGLYIAGIVGAMAAAALLKRTVAKGGSGGFMMELPRYQLPVLRDVMLGLWQRVRVFMRRAGTMILAVTAALWLLTSYPQVPEGSSMKQSEYSIAGRIASVLEPVVRPIGFGHDMAMAIIPAMAAREVAVSALQTVYSIDEADETKGERELGERLRGGWSLPTALAFLAWFVFAPQCLSTIAVIRRETNGWLWPSFTLAYLFVMAWLAAGATFWTATALGL
ncbi:ferrous iron transporter B [Sphingomonas sp.]|uniref:ferrous iron transporter B n=1 Tax=Sphingomonas sp. TaxID=28214 RepID=UPI000DB7229E|nr:ferrous iron transporter B [Sphingomonas sp.]PZU10940.1 MAG: ferrous iron transporter B [Sphingomonas sp.]